MTLRQTLVIAIGSVALLAAIAASMTLGAVHVPLAKVLDALTGQADPGPLRQIVLELRLPRTLEAIAVGAALGVAGALLQGALANPLASPDVIGVTGGAGFGAILILLVFPSSIALLPVGALAFGLLAAALVFVVAWSGPNPGGIGRLILAGIAISALFAAAMTSLMALRPERVPSAIFFLAGGLTTSGWTQLEVVWPYLTAGFVLALALMRPLDRLALGDDVAAALGAAAAGDPPCRRDRRRAAGRLGRRAGRAGRLRRPLHPPRRAARRAHGEPLVRRARLGAVRRRAAARRRHARAHGRRADRAAGRAADGRDRGAAVPVAAAEDGVTALPEDRRAAVPATADEGRTTAPLLEARDVQVRIGGVPILHGADLSVAAGELVAVVGPNGAGKSTLARAVAGLQRTSGGSVQWGGVDVRRMRGRALARRRAFVPQRARVPDGILVRDAVRIGRSPHVGPLQRMTRADHDAVEHAMERAGVAALAERVLPTLSGGELQRVQIAVALAQEAPVVIADEPTAHLDLGATAGLARLLRELTSGGLAVVLVVHDLALAAAVADRVVVMAGGRSVATGPAAEVLQRERLAEVWRVDAALETDADGHTALRVAWLADVSDLPTMN